MESKEFFDLLDALQRSRVRYNMPEYCRLTREIEKIVAEEVPLDEQPAATAAG